MDVNYCREQHRKEFCTEEYTGKPINTESCDKKCPLGRKPDKRGCYSTCECRGAKNFKGVVFGDLRLSKAQIRQLSTDDRTADLLQDVTAKKWDNNEKNGVYHVPYTTKLIT